MIKFLMLTLMYLFSLKIYSANILDVYGADPSLSRELIKTYGAELAAITTKEYEFTKNADYAKNEKALESLSRNRLQLIDAIKQRYGFIYVNFDTVFYPNKKDIYTTVEVIKKEDSSRLRFISQTSKAAKQPPKHDLIEKMRNYQSHWGQLIFKHFSEIKDPSCPVYHCLPGFSHPQLKNEFDELNKQAMKEKDLILRTLKQDPVPERRAAAAFLMGYVNDPYEIIRSLTEYIRDSEGVVRNAAMRVIYSTLAKAKIQDSIIDPLPYLSLLDSPLDTDRNKALIILSLLADSKKSRAIIAHKGKEKLFALLDLKQPNNHNPSYTILKKLGFVD